MTRRSLTLLAIIIGFVSCLFFVQPAVAAEAAPCTFTPASGINLPGGSLPCDGKLLANYIVALNVFFYRLAIVLAVLMITIGGFQWLSGMGNASKISNAKETIEGAERFGLAQLHQFRGRVGRNDMQSYCLLFTAALGANVPERLKLLCREQDGFALAEADLKLRGEGQLFGTQQSGIALFKIATLHDTDLIQHSRRWVDAIVKKDTQSKFYKSIEHKLTTITRHRE